MNCKNISRPMARLLMALALVGLLPALALAQSRPTAEDSARYKEREAYIAKLRQRREDTAAELTGWLILEGKLIPGPYAVSVQGDTILVNGMPAMYRKRRMRPDGSEPILIDSQAIARFEFRTEFWDSFDVWYTKHDFDSAMKHGVSFLNASPLVEYARIDSGDIVVKFDGKLVEETFFMYPVLQSLQGNRPLDTSKAMTQKRREYRAAKLAERLGRGELLFITGNSITAIQPQQAHAAILEIRRIVDSLPDLEERQQALRKILPSARVAKAVAENFDR